MSYFVILDCNANLVESFDHEDEARAALEQIARQDPDNAPASTPCCSTTAVAIPLGRPFRGHS